MAADSIGSDAGGVPGKTLGLRCAAGISSGGGVPGKTLGLRCAAGSSSGGVSRRIVSWIVASVSLGATFAFAAAGAARTLAFGAAGAAFTFAFAAAFPLAFGAAAAACTLAFGAAFPATFAAAFPLAFAVSVFAFGFFPPAFGVGASDLTGEGLSSEDDDMAR
ncbi:MAG: hypothetical protein GY772_19910 [bacterium]|nr:hypothetical protein [bacterium]